MPADDSSRTGNVSNSDKLNNKLSDKPTELAEPELSEIIKAWPDLPPNIRTAIKAIVRASINKQEG